jgi:hypothetical protein
MNSIKNACSLNNQGVSLLVSGESRRALYSFQSALSFLKKADCEAETTSCTEMNISCDEASVPFYESTSPVSGLQELHCYVYDRGIMISDNVNGNTNETMSLFTAIVLFNSALASHSEGAVLGREKSLMKASTLYNLVVALLTGCTMPEVHTFTTILTLLASNNKAQIHYDQCEYVEAVNCMKEILKIIGSTDGLHSVLNGTDFDGLLLNAMVLTTPTAAQAA